jgi:hypothetical protein
MFESDEEIEDVKLTVNKDFAERFQQKKEKEEFSQCKF